MALERLAQGKMLALASPVLVPTTPVSTRFLGTFVSFEIEIWAPGKDGHLNASLTELYFIFHRDSSIWTKES